MESYSYDFTYESEQALIAVVDDPKITNNRNYEPIT